VSETATLASGCTKNRLLLPFKHRDYEDEDVYIAHEK